MNVPVILQAAGYVSRSIPLIKGKWFVCLKLLSKYIKGKGYTTTISFDKGEKINLHLDDWFPYQYFFLGIKKDEIEHTKFFRDSVKEGMIILDIGANIGYYTLQAAARVGENGQVHAFEPVSATFNELTENIKLNNLHNVFANKFIVHKDCDKRTIFVSNKYFTGWSSLSPDIENYSGKTECVESITIDDYVEQRRIKNVHLAKIDVEGSEISVLKGMKRLLAGQGHLQLLIEIAEKHLKSQGSNPQEIIDYLQSFGFHPFKISRNGLTKIHPSTTDYEYQPLVVFSKK